MRCPSQWAVVSGSIVESADTGATSDSARRSTGICTRKSCFDASRGAKPKDSLGHVARQQCLDEFRGARSTMKYLKTDALRMAIEDLAKTYPDRYTNSEKLLADLATHEKSAKEIADAAELYAQEQAAASQQ